MTEKTVVQTSGSSSLFYLCCSKQTRRDNDSPKNQKP